MVLFHCQVWCHFVYYFPGLLYNCTLVNRKYWLALTLTKLTKSWINCGSVVQNWKAWRQLSLEVNITARTQKLGTLDFNFLNISEDTEMIDIKLDEKEITKLADLTTSIYEDMFRAHSLLIFNSRQYHRINNYNLYSNFITKKKT